MLSDKLRAQGQGERLLKEALKRIDSTVGERESLKKRANGELVEKYLKMKTTQFKNQ